MGTVTGTDGTKIKVDTPFISTYPFLYDSIYIVGGDPQSEAKIHSNTLNFLNETYKHYKPIGVATTAGLYIQPSDKNNLAGIVFTKNNLNFGEEFVKAIIQQRF